MLKIKPPDLKFCPMCGKKLALIKDQKEKRKFCQSCGWVYYPRVAVAAGAIVLKGNTVLLVKRNIEPHRGKWTLPAGFVDYGEHPEETIIREVKEETGVKAEIGDFFGLYQVKEDSREPGHFFFAYKMKIIREIIHPGVEETEVRWFSLDELPPLAWKTQAKILDKLRKKSNAQN